MHAANVFNFNLAINYHSHLKAWQHAAGVAMDDERAKIIDQTISELQWLKEQHPLWSFLVDWNKALDTNNPKAIGAWVAKMTDIFRQEPDLLQMSLVDQLRRRHYAQWGEDIMSAPVEPSPAILPSTPLEQKVTRVLSGSRQLDIQQLLFIWNEFIKKADLATDDEFSRWLEITQQGIEALAEDTMDKDWVQLEEKIQKAIKVINAITVNYSNQSKREKYFIWIHQLEAVKTSIHKQRSVKPRV